MTAVRRSLAFSALDSYVALILQIASTVILARILTPEQTGIFAVAAVFASLASTFRDFGVAEYLIQEKELTDTAIRAALTVNIGVSWAMALLIFGLAPWASDFYQTPGVGDVMRVQAVSFLLIPFGAVTMAWFRREMDFKPIFIAGLTANITSFGAVLLLALNGFGYMSLAWSSLVGVAVTVAAALWLRPPSFPRWPGLQGVGKVVQFGKFASGIYIFGQLGKGAPEMIIGRTQDMAAVGMFSRAQGLVEIFNRLVLRTIMPVYLPFFAQGVRDEGTPRRGLLLAMSYLTVVGWPFLAFMALASFAVIRLMYGTQWMDAVPLARLLCLVAAIELVFVSSKEAMLAQGLVRQCNSLQIGVQVLRILGLMAAVPFGLPGACWGLLCAAVLGALLSQAYLAKHTRLTWGDVLAALWPSLKVSLACALPLALWVILDPTRETNYLRLLFIGGPAYAAIWLLALRWTKHPLWPEVARVGLTIRARLRPDATSV
jgi:O-antigen/teichoic acid export membrane protein